LAGVEILNGVEMVSMSSLMKKRPKTEFKDSSKRTHRHKNMQRKKKKEEKNHEKLNAQRSMS
jgi:hypothetical protein